MIFHNNNTMDYNRSESTVLAYKNATALYQKGEYTSVVLLLNQYKESTHFKVLQWLAKAYYNLQMFSEVKTICDRILKTPGIQQNSQLSFLYLLALSEYQLTTNTWKVHRDSLSKKFSVQVKWDTIKTNKSSAAEISQKIAQLMKQQQEFKYFGEAQLPAYIIPLNWFQQLEKGVVKPIDSFHLVELNQFIEGDKSLSHFNYLLKEEKMQCKDYQIVGAKTWKYISSTVGGMEIKRFTIKSGNDVTVEAKFRLLKILCASSLKTKLIALPVSRYESIAALKDRIKKVIIRYNLIEKEALLSSKNPKLLGVKNIYNPQLLSKLIYASTGPIIDYPCIELSDLVTIQEIEVLPKQFLVYELTKSPVLHCTKQELNSITRCVVCSSADPPILCECKTVSYCSMKCKSNHNKHHDICKQLMKEKTGVVSLINAFGINKDSKIPTDMRSSKTGLENIGNTCFLNAAMQCIVGIEKLSLYFFKNEHLKDLNVRNPLGSEGKLACAYGQFLKELFFTNRRAIEPRTLKKIVERKNSTFSGYQQQDSQQFLSYFLDLIHEDLNRVKDKPHVQNIESDGRSDEIIARITLENYYKRNKSIISDLMVGQYRSQLLCPDCGKISITFDPYTTVTLPLPNNRDKIEMQGYLISQNGQINKVEQRVSNSKSIEDTLSNFTIKSCYATIKEKEIMKQFDLKDPISTLINSRYVMILYQLGEHDDVEFHLQIRSGKTKELMAITRRVFSAPINNQKELQSFAYKCMTHPFTKFLNIKEDAEQYLEYCFNNKLIDFKDAKFEYPITQGVHKLSITLKPQIEQKVKLNISYGRVNLQKAANELSIPFLLKNFSIPEQLTEDNSWYCNACKKHQLATKKLSLYSVPEYLVLHLKRFSNKIHGRYVFNQKIDTPIRLEEVEEINGRKYELFGIVNHTGTMSGGHYTSFVKKSEWMFFDDERCRKANYEGTYAYLLFYKALN